MEYLRPEEWRSLGASSILRHRDAGRVSRRNEANRGGRKRAIARGMAAAGAAAEEEGGDRRGRPRRAAEACCRRRRQAGSSRLRSSAISARRYEHKLGIRCSDASSSGAEVRAYGVMLEEALAAAEETVVEEERRTLAAFAALAEMRRRTREGRPSFAVIAAEVGARRVCEGAEGRREGDERAPRRADAWDDISVGRVQRVFFLVLTHKLKNIF